MALSIEVVLSTYNGVARLDRTLNSFARQSYDRTLWRLIVVNNGSTDGTSSVIRSFEDRINISLFDHPNPGKSGALNVALGRVKADLIVLTDDDVRAEIGWLASLASCAENNADYGIFGGQILPEWEFEPGDQEFLKWIPMGSTFAIVDEPSSGPCDHTKVWGPNTAIRREAFDRGIRYREDLGPIPDGMFAMGEDQDIVMQAHSAGFKSYRCSEAIVYHWIPAASVSERWVQKRGERLGYGQPALFPNSIPKGFRLGGVPLQTWIESLHWWVRAGVLYPLPNSKWRFWAIWRCYFMRGYRLGIRKFANAK